MAVLSQRTALYQVGLLVLIVGTALFSTGFGLPHWTRQTATAANRVIVHSSLGLWQVCSETGYRDYDLSACTFLDTNDEWVMAVRVLQSCALGVLFLVHCYLLAANCLLSKPTHTRFIEAGAGLAGMLGAAGLVIYLVQVMNELEDTAASSQAITEGPSLSHAFGLNAGGCACIVIAMVIVAVGNKPMAGGGGDAGAGTADLVPRAGAAPGRSTHACPRQPAVHNPYVITTLTPTAPLEPPPPPPQNISSLYPKLEI